MTITAQKFKPRKFKLLKTATLLLALGSMSGCTTVAVMMLNEMQLTQLQPKNDNIYVLGDLNSKTFKQMKAVTAANPKIDTLVFTAMLGSLDDETTFAMGRWLREQKFNTHLTAKSVIASGAVDLYLSGVNRTMEKGAKFGVHSWSDGSKEAADFPKDHKAHQLNLNYIVDMDVPADFYWFTIYQAPADSIYWMSDAEVTKYGLTTAPITHTDTSGNIPFNDFEKTRLEILEGD